jgi:hypothetical protein
VLDTAIQQSRDSDIAGVRAPKFQIERVISGSRAIVKGAPFDDGPASPLWADAQAKVAKLQAGGKINPAEAATLLADTRAALLTIKPAYDRVIGCPRATPVDLHEAPGGLHARPHGFRRHGHDQARDDPPSLHADPVVAFAKGSGRTWW